LASVADDVAAQGIRPPAVIVVGAVADLAHELIHRRT
jgi:siroheme synthase